MKKSFPKGYVRDTSKDKVVYLTDDTDDLTLLLQKNRRKKKNYQIKKKIK